MLSHIAERLLSIGEGYTEIDPISDAALDFRISDLPGTF